MSERLNCFKNCPFRRTGQIRPCADEAYENNIVCMDNIKSDPALNKFGKITPFAGMDDLMNHQVEVQKIIEGEKGEKKIIIVATVSCGAITLQF